MKPLSGFVAGDEPAAQQGIVNVRLNVFPARKAPGVYNFSSITAAFDAYNVPASSDFTWQGRVLGGSASINGAWTMRPAVPRSKSISKQNC